MYNSNNHRESLEHANDWLTKRLQLTEEQVREGEEVNATLTEENRHLKTAKTVLNAKLDDLTSELEQLQTSVQDYSAEKQSLLSNIGSLEQEVSVLRQEDENAKHLADELKSEMERMQDMVASRAQEVEDMRLYISQLEDRNERQEERSETQLAAMYQALSEKDEYITQMQRNLNDMEASLLTKGSTPADISKSLAIEMVEDDNICFSSPVEVKGSVEYLRNKLADGESSITELQMKLETVQVANEIYQEEVKDLQCRLETSLQTLQNSLSEVDFSAMAALLQLYSKESDSPFYQDINSLLFRGNHVEVAPSTSQRIVSSPDTDTDSPSPSEESLYQSFSCPSVSEVSTQTPDFCVMSALTQTDRLLFTDISIQTESANTCQATSQTIERPVVTSCSQTDLQGIAEFSSPPDPCMVCSDSVLDPGIMPSVLLPRMCDVMVECSITIERPSQDMFTQCDLKQLTSIPGVDVGVQTEPPQKTSTSVQAMLLDLRHSLKDASQTVDDLDSYAAGDCVPATLSLDSDQDASPQGVMAIEDKDKKWGLELACGDTRARPSNASRMSHQAAVYSTANRDEICNRCNERKEGGQLLNCLTTATAVALALVLFIGWYLNLSVDTHGVAFQKHNGHVGVPPH